MHPLRTARRFGLKARELYTRRYAERDVSEVGLKTVRSILSEYDDRTVFVHAGMSDVNAALGGRSYGTFVDELRRQFENVLVPGFTPTFRKSGVYHTEFSRPQVGMFPILFMRDADYRTNDPIHSIQVAGEYRFDDCDHRRTFADDGCWAQLDRDNVLVANIGTTSLTATQYHYVSLQADTPYHTTEKHSGVIYHDEDEYERVEQESDTFTGIYNWNRWKMEEYLESRGVLDRRDTGGLKLSFVRAGDMRRELAPKVDADPYYMVT